MHCPGMKLTKVFAIGVQRHHGSAAAGTAVATSVTIMNQMTQFDHRHKLLVSLSSVMPKDTLAAAMPMMETVRPAAPLTARPLMFLKGTAVQLS